MASSEGSIPERLLRYGRAVDPLFDPEERLFRRFSIDQIAADGRLAATAIGYQGWSVNRSKYSEPEDVLLPAWPLWGIAMLAVNQLPDPLKSSEGTNLFEFKPEHKPEEANYSHTEVITYKNGLVAHNPNPPAEVKKKYRQLVRDRIEIVKTPSA